METRVVIDSKFDFSNVVATSALFNHCKTHKFPLLPYLVRHANCDWGDVCKSEWESNDKAVKEGLRILSEYKLPDGLKNWIITEADRSSTTMLFSEDY